jgi:DNA-binding NarL/FixJ family response regulator
VSTRMRSNDAEVISVALVTKDPAFLFFARALLGKDRRTRIHSSITSLAGLQSIIQVATAKIDVAVCDLDSVVYEDIFYDQLLAFATTNPSVKILCIAEGALKTIPIRFSDFPVRGLVAKSDLGYCLHLAIHALALEKTKWFLITHESRKVLNPRLIAHETCKLIQSERIHDKLSSRPRAAELIVWRCFIGLDNKDIQDEFVLGESTVREHISKAYEALGVNNELEAFEALSEWWWISRFGLSPYHR